MDKSPNSKVTLRQAVSGKWQIPMFAVSVAVFVLVLLQLRPNYKEPTFEEKFNLLQQLTQENRYREFYQDAEALRQSAKNEFQLGQVHGIVAQTRVQELTRRHEFGYGNEIRRSEPANYQAIIRDYNEALARNWKKPDSAECAIVYRNMAMAYWGLKDAEKAIICLKKAITVSETFDSNLQRTIVEMYLSSRLKNYLGESMSHLDELLQKSVPGSDDQIWAYLRKVEVFIMEGRQEEALALLDAADASVKTSKYAEELNLLRARALRYVGRLDEADLILRDLISRITDRGDIYAQAALELGKINYQQYRDHDARYFYNLAVESQWGKDWYTAGELGLAECAAMQQRYDQAVNLYQETVKLYQRNPHNRAVSGEMIRESLALLAHNLSLYKQYSWALSFLEIEQQITPADSRDFTQRLAQMHSYMAKQIQDQLNQSRQTSQQPEPTEPGKLWVSQQEKRISAHYEQAAECYLRVTRLAAADDELFGDNLYNAAIAYNKAGNGRKTIETWQKFVVDREGRDRWPQALFNLGQAYQAIGQYGKSLTYYNILLDKHPNSPAAFDAMVPMAKCYLAQEPPATDKAEQILLSMMDNRALTPVSGYFRQAMFVLGELYYNTQKYDRAITILSEAIERYPDDRGLGKSMFLVADSYRESGLALDETIEKLAQDATATVSHEKMSNQRRKYLENAREFYSSAIDFYQKLTETQRTALDSMYLQHSYLYRADCLYYLGRCREASEFYEDAVNRYQLTQAALTSFVQIINCQIQLGNAEAARSANQRAIWQLNKMPDEALAAGTVTFSRQQWQDWFDWTAKSGLW